MVILIARVCIGKDTKRCTNMRTYMMTLGLYPNKVLYYCEELKNEVLSCDLPKIFHFIRTSGYNIIRFINVKHRFYLCLCWWHDYWLMRQI